MSSFLKTVLGTLALIVIVGGALIWRSEAIRARSQALAMEYDAECPPGSTPRVQGWGKSGFSVSCYSQVNEWNYGVNASGPFAGFEAGSLQVLGQMENGQPVGEWTYLDESGNVEHVVRH